MKIRTVLFTLCYSLGAFSKPIASGKLLLSASLVEKAKGIRTVFISIYDPKSPRPMPCAAQKFTLKEDAKAGEFFTFTLDSDSVMKMGCEAMPNPMNLKAKLDKDGYAGPDSSGDITGTVKGVKDGTKTVKIEMDKLIE